MASPTPRGPHAPLGPAAEQLARCARLLHDRGWVANHDGNATVRLGPDRFLITPTAISKRLIDPDMLVLVDSQGRKISGRMRPFSEQGLHHAVYAARPDPADVGAVLHAHPPYATAFALAHLPLFSPPTSPEPVVSLGPEIPLVPYAAPGAAAEAALRPFAAGHNAVLLANHGVLTWGPDLETAYCRMELVEHIAQTTAIAAQLGGARPIPAADVQALNDKRIAAGLAPPALSQETDEADDALVDRIGREVARALRGA